MVGSNCPAELRHQSFHAIPALTGWGFGSLLALLIWLPIPWGSEPPWATSLAITWTFLIILITAIRGFRPSAYRTIRIPLVLFILCLLYVFLQAMPLGGLMASAPNQLAGPLSAFGSRVVSLSPSDTLERFLLYTAYFCCFVATITYVDSPIRASRVAYVLVGMGVCESIFGFYTFTTGFEFVPKLLQDGHWERVTGTFVNRNQFGAHLVIALSMAIGLFLSADYRKRRYPGWRYWAHLLSGRRALLLASMVLMACALLYTGSRGALLALLISVLACLVVDRWSDRRRQAAVRMTILVAGTITLALLLTGTGGIYSRLVSVGLDPGERLAEWRLLVPMLKDFYLWGCGAGTFEWSFPFYRDGGLRPLLYNHAHSDVLETLIELGLFGFILVASAILITVGTLLKICYDTDRGRGNGVLYACLIAVPAFLIQSLVDANFQVPANGFYFFTVLGLGVSSSSFNNGTFKQSNV